MYPRKKSCQKHPRQYFHYRMLGLGPPYKASKTWDFIVPCDVEQKQIVAIEFGKPDAQKKMGLQFAVRIFDRFLTSCFLLKKH